MNILPNIQQRLARFLNLSAELTAFSVFQLRGTGQAEAYLAAVEGVIGVSMLTELLDAHSAIPSVNNCDEQAIERRLQQLRQQIFGQEKLGAIARNIIKLWYIGTWCELPADWNDRYGPLTQNADFVVSPSSYVEGLLWPAIGAHPEGAKAQGFGSWAQAPNIPAF
jgi:hypothetical protein